MLTAGMTPSQLFVLFGVLLLLVYSESIYTLASSKPMRHCQHAVSYGVASQPDTVRSRAIVLRGHGMYGEHQRQ
jgi:hypothetical protein